MPVRGPAVFDASIALKWVLPEPGSDVAVRLYEDLVDTGATLYVPDLFWLETANALWRRARGRTAELSTAEAFEAFAVLRSAPLRTEPVEPLAGRALEIALTADLTTYDSAYVTVAETKAAGLWTADARLVEKLTGTEWQGHVTLLESLEGRE